MKFKYKIGDVVKIINSGSLYTTYYDAFIYFNLTRYMYKNKCNKLFLPSDYNFENETIKWVVVGMAYHGYDMKTKLYCLMSPNLHKYVIIGEKGIVLNDNFTLKQISFLKSKMLDYKIKPIPKMSLKEKIIFLDTLNETIYGK